ncbi:MAG: WbqC family protein [Calditrichaceae bacterium]|nr:WbqC family protein [Calditrichaceae bacterium]MBN2710267.1 WbqC family protein [Calditrichaceae bacterium]RQV93888.1 MAG: hypothetical protein EH224_11725 [Calditrichota bacterium]
MGKKVAILQSNYIPWKGYFDLINIVDEFIIYDSAQYTKQDWRNRNKIKTKNGIQWLSIPVKHVSISQAIIDIEICQSNWGEKHWRTLEANYAKAKYFKNYRKVFSELYKTKEIKLSSINSLFIHAINDILGIKTKITWSSDYELVGGRTERLLNLCIQSGASTYLSGPAAKNYLDEALFKKAGLIVQWMDYSSYRKYNQLYPPFDHYVSIIDLIFNEGPNAVKFMKSF